MIIVCFMINCKFNNERFKHDTQRFYKKDNDQFIAEYADPKLYA